MSQVLLFLLDHSVDARPDTVIAESKNTDVLYYRHPKELLSDIYKCSIFTPQIKGTHEDTYLIPGTQLMYTSVHSDVTWENCGYSYNTLIQV